MRESVRRNDRGWRMGESHQKVKLSDDDVELIRALRDDGMRVKQICEKFETSINTINDIIYYRTR